MATACGPDLKWKSPSTADSDFLAPLLEAESELSHDIFDDQQHDDAWWEEFQRDRYVQLYRRAAQLEAEGGRPVRSCISVPPARSDEQGDVEHEGRELACLSPNRRWSLVDWREMGRDAIESDIWPPAALVDALREAERRVDENRSPNLPQPEENLRFQIGQRVFARISDDDWCGGTIVWRNYLSGGCYHPYQILLDTCDDDDCVRLLFASVDLNPCIRAADGSLSDPLKENRCTLVCSGLLKVLMVAWWIMPNGYDECDIGGLVDVNVPRGIIGAGLVDIELAAGLEAHYRFEENGFPLLNDRTVQKILDRLQAIEDVDTKRDEETADEEAQTEIDAPNNEGETPMGLEDLTEEQMKEAVRVNWEKCFDPTIPGGPLADLFKGLIGEDECVPLRDKRRCTFCGERSKKQDLKVCGRCYTACYCGRTCQLNHRAIHKRTCTTRKQRVKHIMDTFSNVECNHAMVEAALTATDEHVQAARMICAALITTGFVGVSTEEEFCSMLKLLFSVKLGPSDLDSIASADRTVKRKLKLRRKQVAADERAKIVAMAPVVSQCGQIYEALIKVLPAVGLCRYSGPGAPHNSNRNLLDYTFGAIESSYHNIPAFLLLVDECVSSSDFSMTLQGCPYQPKQLRKRFRKLEKMAFSTWAQFGKVFDGDDEESDEEVVKMQRARWCVHAFREIRGKNFDLEEWRKQPGSWVPRKLLAK